MAAGRYMGPWVNDTKREECPVLVLSCLPWVLAPAGGLVATNPCGSSGRWRWGQDYSPCAWALSPGWEHQAPVLRQAGGNAPSAFLAGKRQAVEQAWGLAQPWTAATGRWEWELKVEAEPLSLQLSLQLISERNSISCEAVRRNSRGPEDSTCAEGLSSVLCFFHSVW